MLDKYELTNSETEYHSGLETELTDVNNNKDEVIRNVKNVDVDASPPEQVYPADTTPTFVIVAGDDLRRVGGELGDAMPHVFGRVRREVSDQFVIDGEIRR